MNKERDLLMRVKVLLECVDTAPLQDQADLAIKEIQELLQPEPLSEDKLDALAEANITDEGIAGYYLGFRDAEKMHGIGGENE